VQPFLPDTLVGTVLDGRYRLRAHLASGGMGAIFRAEHVYMRNELAVKVLRPELSALPDLAERFRREAEIAASLEHDHIVRVTDFGRSCDGLLFLAMELLRGESLFERMRAGPLSPAEAIPILTQICDGLDAAHALGVVHRDLKPENVFLCRSARAWVKLLDFGIAKITDPVVPSETAAGVVVGTPEYVSPEQASGGAVDGRADVYAVGIVAWSLLAGRHPFPTTDSRRLLMMQATQVVPPLARERPNLEAWPDLCEVVARACAKDPAARYQTAGDMRDALLACLGPDARAEALAPARPSLAVRTGWSSPGVDGAGTVQVDAPPASGAPSPYGLVVRPPTEVLLDPDGASASTSRPAAAPLGAGSGAQGGPESTGGPPRLRRHLVRAALAAAVIAAVAAAAWGGLEWSRWRDGAPVRQAERLLAEGRPTDARDALAPALARQPPDPRAQVLLARALDRIPGARAEALDAFEVASRNGTGLDATAMADVAALLGSDRKTAERAARLLEAVGAPAVPPVLDAARRTRGAARLRALGVLRALGAEDRLAVADAYVPLLADADCEVRRAAARRLGEVGDASVAPKLAELAAAKREVKGFLFTKRAEPVCGAAEAAAALKRVQARR
jgi:hypothetical protein